MGRSQGSRIVQTVTDHQDLVAKGGKFDHTGGFFGGEDTRPPSGYAKTVSQIADRGFGIAGEEFHLQASGLQGGR